MTMPPDQAPQRKWVLDKTLNVPTLLTIGTLVVGAASFGVSTMNDQNNRMSEQDRRIDSVERKADSAVEGIKRVEALQSMQAQNQDAQLQTLRNEFRSDLRDINSKLDTLLLNSGGFRPETKGWTKP